MATRKKTTTSEEITLTYRVDRVSLIYSNGINLGIKLNIDSDDDIIVSNSNDDCFFIPRKHLESFIDALRFVASTVPQKS